MPKDCDKISEDVRKRVENILDNSDLTETERLSDQAECIARQQCKESWSTNAIIGRAEFCARTMSGEAGYQENSGTDPNVIESNAEKAYRRCSKGMYSPPYRSPYPGTPFYPRGGGRGGRGGREDW